MPFNLADLFELAVDAFPEREYLVANGSRRTYRQMDERANQLAHHLAAQGVGPGDHVGIYGYNTVEWIEALWAVFKLRGVWININYRYVEDELSYLVGNADLVALLHQSEFTERVANVRGALPMLRHTLVMDAPEYEAALAAQSPERNFGPRSGDDHYILYTGGTTGMPKGVVWRHEDVFYALGGGIDPYTGKKVDHETELVERAQAAGAQATSLPIAPLMHGATQWAVMGMSFHANRVILMAKFDPHEVWHLVEEEKINTIMITGDAMGRPMVEALDTGADKYDTSSLFALTSSAAIFSASVKDDFFEHFPNLIMVDAIGSSESGSNGMMIVKPGETAMEGGPRVTAFSDTIVFDEDFKLVEPRSGQVGKIARGGHVPIGYYKDPVKTAETFVVVDGERYAMPGDFVRMEEDGTVTLLGRGSVSINSGGEKIYPEEVEGAVKSHPAIYDATVVGVPDERWGQRVVAVVQLREGMECPPIGDVQVHCRTKIAGYKVPRELHVVDAIVRSPSGKPDYRWAQSVVATSS